MKSYFLIKSDFFDEKLLSDKKVTLLMKSYFVMKSEFVDKKLLFDKKLLC